MNPKLALLLVTTSLVSASSFASTFCGKFETQYIGPDEGGGSRPTLLVPKLAGDSEQTTTYTLSNFSTNPLTQSLRKSITNLLLDERGYCFKGVAKGSTLTFTSASINNSFSDTTYDGLYFSMKKNDVFRQNATAPVSVSSTNQPEAVTKTVSCKISWNEVNGSSVVNH